MGKEEITDELKEMKSDIWTDERQMIALNAAIEALEKLPKYKKKAKRWKRKWIEQNRAINIIRQKITELRDSWKEDCYHDEADALTLALDIIDEYIGDKNEQVD